MLLDSCKTASTSLAFLLGLAASSPAVGTESGRAAFEEQCASCHPINGHSSKSGPSLDGVVWRKIASLRDFAYSAGLKAKVGSWSPQALDAYLKNTQGFAPGTDMFWNIQDRAERRAIIRYLETSK